MNSCLSSSRPLLIAAVRLLRLFCQPMSMALHVSQDYCTSLWRSVTGHVALHGYSHALWRAMTTAMPLTVRLGTRIIINREFDIETVPYTNRTHMVVCSPKRESAIGERRFASFKKEHASKILDPHHHESVRVHNIGWKIIRAIDHGLYIKSEKERRGQEPLQMMMRLNWIDELNWEVIVVEEKDGRGRSLPGGKIIISTGLLDHFSTDAEIATVIAHEVGHLIARHMCEMIKILVLWFPTRLLVTPFLRRHEVEADYIGMLLLAAAGFDPHAAPLCLDKAGKMKGESAFTNFLSFFSSKGHPSCKKRSRLLSQPKVMEEAMELYREANQQWACQ